MGVRRYYRYDGSMNELPPECPFVTESDYNRLDERCEAAESWSLARSKDYDALRGVAERLAEALDATDSYARQVTELFLLPTNGECVSCHEQVPPAGHQPNCKLKPLMKAIREAWEKYETNNAQRR